ncbi:hypothetical protein RP20_CCG013276 [Aedes albopictus]|nr:hypothetical protein RP20_CCG013276 [Aedes albopictus]
MTSKVNNYSLTQRSDWCCWWAAIIIKANSNDDDDVNYDINGGQVRDLLRLWVQEQEEVRNVDNESGDS